MFFLNYLEHRHTSSCTRVTHRRVLRSSFRLCAHVYALCRFVMIRQPLNRLFRYYSLHSLLFIVRTRPSRNGRVKRSFLVRVHISSSAPTNALFRTPFVDVHSVLCTMWSFVRFLPYTTTTTTRNRRLWGFLFYFTASRQLAVICNHIILAISNMCRSFIFLPEHCARFLRLFKNIFSIRVQFNRTLCRYVQHRSRRTPDRTSFEPMTVGISSFSNFFPGSSEEFIYNNYYDINYWF